MREWIGNTDPVWCGCTSETKTHRNLFDSVSIWNSVLALLLLLLFTQPALQNEVWICVFYKQRFCGTISSSAIIEAAAAAATPPSAVMESHHKHTNIWTETEWTKNQNKFQHYVSAIKVDVFRQFHRLLSCKRIASERVSNELSMQPLFKHQRNYESVRRTQKRDEIATHTATAATSTRITETRALPEQTNKTENECGRSLARAHAHIALHLEIQN